MTQKKFKAGSASNIDYLSEKISLNQKEQTSMIIKAQRLNDCINLYKSVGGAL